MSDRLLVAVLTGLSVVAVIGGLLATFGSVHGVVMWTQGYSLFVSRQAVHLGTVQRIEERPFTVTVENTSGRDYRLIGANNLCSCRLQTPLPLDVPAGGRVTVDLTLLVPPSQPPGVEGTCVWNAGNNCVSNSSDACTGRCDGNT